MTKETFKDNLIKASQSAMDLARHFTFNKIYDNCVYQIRPNVLDLGNHLTDLEKENLKCRINELNITLTIEEVINKLLIENSVPLWVNCSVIRSKNRLTTIELETSRRFRKYFELYHDKEGCPPFHAVITWPSYLFETDEEFDVNWRFNKVQTFFKLRKAKIKLKQELKRRRN